MGGKGGRDEMNKLWIFMHRCRVTFTEPGKERIN